MLDLGRPQFPEKKKRRKNTRPNLSHILLLFLLPRRGVSRSASKWRPETTWAARLLSFKTPRRPLPTDAPGTRRHLQRAHGTSLLHCTKGRGGGGSCVRLCLSQPARGLSHMVSTPLVPAIKPRREKQQILLSKWIKMQRQTGVAPNGRCQILDQANKPMNR